MQCASCLHTFGDDLSICPQCKLTVPSASEESSLVQSNNETETPAATAPARSETKPERATSTLLEFPGATPRPQWRKELSERVREIQERRARAAVLEPNDVPTVGKTPHRSSDATPLPPLGLVPPAEAAEVNPLVRAALQRVERARQMHPPPNTRVTGSSGAATALARVAEPEFDQTPTHAPRAPAVASPEAKPHAITEAKPIAEAKPITEVSPRASKLIAVQANPIAQVEPQPILPQVIPPSPATATKAEPITASAPQPRRVFDEVLDDAALDRIESDAAASVRAAMASSARAPIALRVLAAVIDGFVVAFIASPFASIIELVNGNWSNTRVSALMVSIVVAVIFLYQVAATALAGRTWGLSLVSLQIVDADSGSAPTTGQAAGRAIIYILSLASFGFGILYALFDAEGRTAHDHLSGTSVVRE